LPETGHLEHSDKLQDNYSRVSNNKAHFAENLKNRNKESMLSRECIVLHAQEAQLM